MVVLEILIDKTITTVPNILHFSPNEKRHFKLEPVEPMSISEIHAILECLKEVNKNFEFRVLWC
jgi:hypothetical protein